MSYIIAGLALLNGLALVIDIAGKQIFDDLRNVKFRGNEQQQFQSSQQSNDNREINVTPVIANPPETEKVTLSQPALAQGGGAQKSPFQGNGQKR